MKHHNIHFDIDKSLVRLWLVLAVAAAGSLADVAEFAVRQPGAALAIAGLVCFATLKATVLTALYAVCRRNSWLKVVAITMIVVFIVLYLLIGVSYLFYGFSISINLFKSMAQTSPTMVR